MNEQPASSSSRAAMQPRAVDAVSPEDVSFAQRDMAPVVVAAAKKSKLQKKAAKDSDVMGAPKRRVIGKRSSSQWAAASSEPEVKVQKRPAGNSKIDVAVLPSDAETAVDETAEAEASEAAIIAASQVSLPSDAGSDGLLPAEAESLPENPLPTEPLPEVTVLQLRGNVSILLPSGVELGCAKCRRSRVGCKQCRAANGLVYDAAQSRWARPA